MKAKTYRASQVDRIIIIDRHRRTFYLLLEIDGDNVVLLEFLYVPPAIIIEQPCMLGRNMWVVNENRVSRGSSNRYFWIIQR